MESGIKIFVFALPIKIDDMQEHIDNWVKEVRSIKPNYCPFQFEIINTNTVVTAENIVVTVNYKKTYTNH